MKDKYIQFKYSEKNYEKEYEYMLKNQDRLCKYLDKILKPFENKYKLRIYIKFKN